MSKWVKFVKAMWALNRALNKRLKEEFSFSERLRATVDFGLYGLFALIHEATGDYRVRPETSDYIVRSMVFVEELDGLPLDAIEEINKAAFEAEPGYRQHKEGRS